MGGPPCECVETAADLDLGFATARCATTPAKLVDMLALAQLLVLAVHIGS